MNEIRRLLCFVALVSACSVSYGQRRVSADVEIKQVTGKEVKTITKSVYCANNGRLVVCFHSPQKSIMTTNALGETQIYSPDSGEVVVDNSGVMNSRDEMLSLFLIGRMDDLGLGLLGYKLSSSVREDGVIRKIFTTDRTDIASRVEVVFKDYLPIYCAYYGPGGRIMTKTYLSKYARLGRGAFPYRSTTVNYTPKMDSTVVRSIYSNIRLDADDPMFDFKVPSDAKVVTIPGFQGR